MSRFLITTMTCESCWTTLIMYKAKLRAATQNWFFYLLVSVCKYCRNHQDWVCVPQIRRFIDFASETHPSHLHLSYQRVYVYHSNGTSSITRSVEQTEQMRKRFRKRLRSSENMGNETKAIHLFVQTRQMRWIMKKDGKLFDGDERPNPSFSFITIINNSFHAC